MRKKSRHLEENMTTLFEKGIELSSSQLASASRDLLALGYSVRFRAKGKSMEPTIMADDLLTVEPIENGNIRLGDVVMIVSGQGRSIVHRVVSLHRGVEGELIQTCGDNASVKDDPVEKEQVLGKIVEIRRGNKRVDSFHFPKMVRALWYLLRARRILDFTKKDM